MELQNGDWVKTESGDVGTVVLIDGLSAFVEFETQGTDRSIKQYLLSALCKIDPPPAADDTVAPCR
jgi:hypothetical protein